MAQGVAFPSACVPAPCDCRTGSIEKQAKLVNICLSSARFLAEVEDSDLVRAYRDEGFGVSNSRSMFRLPVCLAMGVNRCFYKRFYFFC